MHLFISILFICSSLSILAQSADIVKASSDISDLHKNNIGQIYFTDKFIPVAQLEQADFLNTYTLTNKSNLFFVAFMGNSLTNYLHQLSPEASADSLVKRGNFQFSLSIDKREVYRSNLNPGAPQKKFLDTSMVINRAFIDNENGNGTWSESFWNRFLYNGGDSSLTEGPHILRMEIRGYLKADQMKITNPIAAGELNLIVMRKAVINISQIHLNKIKPNSGFAISNEPFDTNLMKALKATITEGLFKKVNSIIVIKNGKLLIEEYFNGETRQTLHDPRSVGKSFASTLMGMAIRDGYIKNEQQQLRQFYNLKFFSNYSTRKAQTTIRDLLTMSSAFDGNDDEDNSPGNEENMYNSLDWVKFTLDLPVDSQKYTGQWHYFTAGVVLLGDILDRSVKGGLEAFANEKLFKPLHINYEWQYTPQHVPNTAGSIKMNALGFASYGQLYKNGGVWNHQQILPRVWVDKSFTKQQVIPGRVNEYYGYLFWNKTFQVGTNSYEAFYCAGNGGNYILMFKELPLVIVITATAYGQPYAHSQVTKMLSEYILPAVVR